MDESNCTTQHVTGGISLKNRPQRHNVELTTGRGCTFLTASVLYLFPNAIHSCCNSYTLLHRINPCRISSWRMVNSHTRQVIPGISLTSPSQDFMIWSSRPSFASGTTPICIRTQRELDLNTPLVWPWSGIIHYPSLSCGASLHPSRSYGSSCPNGSHPAEGGLLECRGRCIVCSMAILPLLPPGFFFECESFLSYV